MADIELVVKIPEDTFFDLKKKQNRTEVDCAILNGTPLPKGHGRLGDLDALRDEVSSWGMNDYEPSDFTDAIDDAPPVEAIPKDQYEARLKADLVAMLIDIQLEIEEYCRDQYDEGEYPAEGTISNIIQQRINKLKEKK